MKSATLEERVDSNPSSPNNSGKNGFEELVRGIHNNKKNDDGTLKEEADLTSQAYVQKLVRESLISDFVASPFGRGVNDDEFHYTSSFKARPQAEYFDFDERYMYRPEKEKRQREDSNVSYANYSLDERGQYGEEEEEDVRMGEMEDEKSEDEECESYDGDDDDDDDLQNVIETVCLCKTIFGDMIDKIDRVALTSVNYKSTKMGVSQMDNEMSDILDTVKGLIPLSCTHQLQQPANEGNSQDNANLDNPLTNMAQGSSYSALRADPCARLPNFGVILIKSPASVSQLWDEYTKIPAEWPVKDLFTFTLLQQGKPNSVSDIELITKRRTPIRQLEANLGSSWRNADKNFSRQINRRKKIWKSIEEGLSDGLSLQVCFDILENYVKNRGKGLSWYYNGVPFKLVEVYDELPSRDKSANS